MKLWCDDELVGNRPPAKQLIEADSIRASQLSRQTCLENHASADANGATIGKLLLPKEKVLMQTDRFWKAEFNLLMSVVIDPAFERTRALILACLPSLSASKTVAQSKAAFQTASESKLLAFVGAGH
jgi:elongation factor P--beta-lysine ligase